MAQNDAALPSTLPLPARPIRPRPLSLYVPSAFISIYTYIHLSFYLTIYLSIRLSIYPSIYFSNAYVCTDPQTAPSPQAIRVVGVGIRVWVHKGAALSGNRQLPLPAPAPALRPGVLMAWGVGPCGEA